GDTGYGEALNVMHMVRTFEDAGAGAVHLEDQLLPKKCGHLNDKKLANAHDMAAKVAAAAKARRHLYIIARTDAAASEVEMDVLGLTYGEYDDATREAIFAAFPRTTQFKEDIIQAFYDGISHQPDTTLGNVKADVIADKEPHFHRGNFCSVIRNSRWHG